jgi:hypothetical protein
VYIDRDDRTGSVWRQVSRFMLAVLNISVLIPYNWIVYSPLIYLIHTQNVRTSTLILDIQLMWIYHLCVCVCVCVRERERERETETETCI